MHAAPGAADPEQVQTAAGPPAFLRLVPDFDPERFAGPEALFHPGYFWLWNDVLDEERLHSQLRDMAAHGARSVVMLPMPHAFRPDSTNNFLEPDYLTPEFFQFVRTAVEEAARLGMNWWLYDEGGWPSGQAAGRVLEGHPELTARRLVREPVAGAPGRPYSVPEDALALVVEEPVLQVFRPGSAWTPGPENARAFLYRVTAAASPDLLNPAVARRFIALTHEGYRRAVGRHFGGAIRLVFTDEPSAGSLRPPDSIPWTPGMEKLYAKRFGREIFADLPLLFTPPGPDVSPRHARARIDFFELWSRRFTEAYFLPLRRWCRRHGLASGGHLNGEDETLGAVRHGFGHALRQLRAMDLPGVDVIWRQLFPGQPAPHHFPKLASSAAHQNGTRHAFTESFAVYGNGLTPAQMKWLVDYQFVRGIDLLVGACYPLGTREHHMTGERPHFGRCNPLWDSMTAFHAYTARLGYCLSVGEPDITAALYYPARDLWARGEAAADRAAAHDALAAELLARQCDFDLIDDDALAAARFDGGSLAVGPMRYRTVVCGPSRWMHPAARERLRAFAAAGGAVLCLEHAPASTGVPPAEAGAFRVFPDLSGLGRELAPTVVLSPATRTLRVAARRVRGGRLVFLFHEGGGPSYSGRFRSEFPHACRLDPATGAVAAVPGPGPDIPVELAPWESAVFLLTESAVEAAPPLIASGDTLGLDAALRAVPVRRFTAGAHDFEIETLPPRPPAPFPTARVWREWLGEDFSGEVEYRAEFDLPAAWAGSALQLETGKIEYAATVFLDGAPAGSIAWPPWRLLLPPAAPGRHELVIRVANTLANELTSARVRREWERKSGPGWPSPYHVRTLAFEQESRGGGVPGPVRLRRMQPPGTRT